MVCRASIPNSINLGINSRLDPQQWWVTLAPQIENANTIHSVSSQTNRQAFCALKRAGDDLSPLRAKSERAGGCR
jgi:hypothetical protein